MRRSLVIVAAALLAGACGGTTTPTPPPPPTEDPPKITCPASQTVQLTTASTIAVTYTATSVNGRAPVTISCAPPSGALFSVGQSTVTCTATDALQRTDVCSFTVTVLPQPKLTVTRFLAFGDSITRGEDGVNGVPEPQPNCPSPTSTSPSASLRFYPRTILPDAQTYPGVLQQGLVDRYTTQSPVVTNRGCPGEAVTDTNPDTLARFRGLTSSGAYDAVLIMEGTNDLMDAHVSGDLSIPGRAEARLRLMVEDARSRNLRPFLATIPPMNKDGSRGSHYGYELVPDFNSSVRLIASAEGVPLVDVEQKFGGNLGLLGADGVHPTAEGYKAIAEVFFDAIKSALEVKTSSFAPSARRR